MPSIRQNPYPEALPDFRNLGITARALIAVNLLALIAALLAEPDWNTMMDAYVMRAARFEPPLVASLVLLYALAPWLLRFTYWIGCAVVIGVVLVFTAVTHVMLGEFAPAGIARTLVLAASCTAVVLAYLRLHTKAHSPAL